MDEIGAPMNPKSSRQKLPIQIWPILCDIFASICSLPFVYLHGLNNALSKVLKTPDVAYEDIPTVLFPLIWFEQTLGMPSSSAFLVRIILNLNDICLTVGILLIILGILTFLFLVYKIRNSDFCPSEHHKNYLPKELVPLKEKETPT